MNTCENLRLILWAKARAHHPFRACCSFSFHTLLVLPMQSEESLAQALSSVRGRSWREAAERANDRRRAHNVSIDGLNQAIIGQSIFVERECSYVKYERFPGAYHTDEIFGGPVQNIDMLPVVVPARTK